MAHNGGGSRGCGAWPCVQTRGPLSPRFDGALSVRIFGFPRQMPRLAVDRRAAICNSQHVSLVAARVVLSAGATGTTTRRGTGSGGGSLGCASGCRGGLRPRWQGLSPVAVYGLHLFCDDRKCAEPDIAMGQVRQALAVPALFPSCGGALGRGRRPWAGLVDL